MPNPENPPFRVKHGRWRALGKTRSTGPGPFNSALPRGAQYLD